MLPGLIAAPFSILSAVLSDTNITDIVRVFNESNITTIGNFTFEPTTLLFVNYPQSGGQKNFDSLVISAGAGNSSTLLNDTLALGNSAEGNTDSTPTDCDEESDGGNVSGTNAEHTQSDANDFLSGLHSTSALQVSLNMTANRSSITEAPIFALNGTYDETDSFFIGIFHLVASNTNNSVCAHFLGGNFTAQSILGGTLSVLTNSTPALLEYSVPLNDSESSETGMLVYLLFAQSGESSSLTTMSSSVEEIKNISISGFIDEIGLGPPIGGTMLWLGSQSNANSTTATLTLEGAIPSDVYYSPSASSSDANSSAFTGLDSSLPTATGTDGQPLSSSNMPGNSSLVEPGSTGTPNATGSEDGSFSTPTNSNMDGMTSDTSAPTSSFPDGFGTATGPEGLSLPTDSALAGPSSSSPLGTDSGTSLPATDSSFPSDSSSETSPVTDGSQLPTGDGSSMPISSTESGSPSGTGDSGSPTDGASGSFAPSSNTGSEETSSPSGTEGFPFPTDSGSGGLTSPVSSTGSVTSPSSSATDASSLPAGVTSGDASIPTSDTGSDSTSSPFGANGPTEGSSNSMSTPSSSGGSGGLLQSSGFDGSSPTNLSSGVSSTPTSSSGSGETSGPACTDFSSATSPSGFPESSGSGTGDSTPNPTGSGIQPNGDSTTSSPGRTSTSSTTVSTPLASGTSSAPPPSSSSSGDDDDDNLPWCDELDSTTTNSTVTSAPTRRWSRPEY